MKRIVLSVVAAGMLFLAGLSLVGAAPASAKYRVGVGEQNPQMIDSPSWQSQASALFGPVGLREARWPACRG